MRLIDADEFIKVIEDVRKIMDEKIINDNRKDLINFVNGLNQACLCVEQQPTIEERQKGKWIKHIDDLYPSDSMMECNVCHEYQYISCDDNFCPNCGADMREAGE